ncbi:GTP pyrophosphokinase family protein [Microbacterium betulae]|uniref:GTP pyrophosphokinase family protein n=1 Tax=Microbacterium betulae TaxID=2981139 RepID=A0AA97FH71_9MICO|nr:GTP pyrophosphokinase family protein [Microbacterium sp. AB]WOF22459.1 GTP pyrophosphokinase family protein [Microbacterium sp. AB]
MSSFPVDDDMLEHARSLRDEMQRFLNQYRFGMREIETKLSILREDFEHAHAYNPIEHVSSRLKTMDSIAEKADRKGIDPSIDAIRENILDIAGVRVTCSFVTDAYRLFELLVRQDDITVCEVKDYIADPKPNGYKSLHAIVEVPVFLSTGTVPVPVEVQFRTIAMDFWASLEHKIYYKYESQVPARLTDSLREAAITAAELDDRMEGLHRELHGERPDPVAPLQLMPRRGDDGPTAA